MNYTKEDLKPGDVVLISNEFGDNLFEIRSDPDDDNELWNDWYDEDRVAAKCFFGPYLSNIKPNRYRVHWIKLECITEVFER